jgi:hypothetical protein
MAKEVDLSHLAESFARFDRLLPETDSLTLLVLNGHLLIEEQLLAMVRSAVPHPEALDEANLRFTQLMYLAKALYYEESTRPIWEAIHALNALRNRLAHRLEPDDLESRVRTFVETLVLTVPGGLKRDDPELARLMNHSLAFVYGALAAMPRRRRPAN